MFDISIFEKQLMDLVHNLAGSRQISKMLLDNDHKGKSVSDYVESKDGKNNLELHLKYITSINQTIAFISELLKKVNELKPKEEAPAQAPAEMPAPEAVQ